MTKTELIEKMAKDAKITKVAAGVVLESFMGNVTKALKQRNGKVTLVGFGTFRKVYRKTRKGRNPQTGKQNELPRGKPRSIGAKTTGVARNEAGYIPLPYLDSEYISESPSHYPFCRRY